MRCGFDGESTDCTLQICNLVEGGEIGEKYLQLTLN